MSLECECSPDLVRAHFEAKHRAYASPMSVRKAMARGEDHFILVDVRNPVARIPTSIEGAIWIPEQDMESRMEELPQDKLLILYCWATWCSLATSAAVRLLDHGFRVKELNGGIQAWQTLGLPEVREPLFDPR